MWRGYLCQLFGQEHSWYIHIPPDCIVFPEDKASVSIRGRARTAQIYLGRRKLVVSHMIQDQLSWADRHQCSWGQWYNLYRAYTSFPRDNTCHKIFPECISRKRGNFGRVALHMISTPEVYIFLQEEKTGTIYICLCALVLQMCAVFYQYLSHFQKELYNFEHLIAV